MIVIVTGSRNFVSGYNANLTGISSDQREEYERDKKYIWDRLAHHHLVTPITLLVEGGARGADSLAQQWAIKNAVHWVTVRADWKAHGKAAGMLRNREMLDNYPDGRVIAFPLVDSIGTRGCIAEAKKRKMHTTVYEQKTVNVFDFSEVKQGKLF